MVYTQCATDEIRRGKKEEIEKKERRKKEERKKKERRRRNHRTKYDGLSYYT